METSIPGAIQPPLDAYLLALEPLRSHLYGIYLAGSLALNAFEEPKSDIDIIVLTQEEWSAPELQQLKALHAYLTRVYPFGRRLEVSYMPSRYLGVMHPGTQRGTVSSYPAAHEGKFSPTTHAGLNAVTWWIIQNKGLCLFGPDRSKLPLKVEWQDVLSAMRFNLDVYFARKVRRPYIYLHSEAVEFAVSNMCRILTTVEEGEIISKRASLARWKDRLSSRWQSLLAEAWRLRYHAEQPPLYAHRLQRMSETLAFIHYGRTRGREALDALSS